VSSRLARAILVGLFLGGTVGLAVAAPGDATFASSPQGVTSMEMLGHLLGKLNNSIARLADNGWARGTAVKIAMVLTLLIAGWSIVKSWLLGKGFPQFLADMMQPLIMLAVVMAAISADFGSAVSRSVDAVGTAVAASTGATAVSEIQLISSMAEAAFNVFRLDSPVSISWTNPGGAIIWVLGLCFKLLTALIFLACGAFAAGVFLVAKLSVAIAVGLGPLLFVWGIWQPTAFLFNGWLKFLITAAMQKVIVVLIAGFIGSALTELTSLSQLLNNSTADIIAYSAMLLFSVLCAMLMWKSPGIATGLLSGHGGLDLSAWKVGGAAAGAGASAGKTVANGADRAGGAAINGLLAGGKAIAGKFGGAKGGGSGGGSSGGGQQGQRTAAPKTATGHAMALASKMVGARSGGGGGGGTGAMGGAGQQGGKPASQLKFPAIVPPAPGSESAKT
jgi:type IV secretion system protein TrbL